MALRILVTGDIHIGRTSSRLPESVPEAAARSVNGWHAVVEHAVTNDFDVLVLTGDVADQDNQFWEALGPLQNGLRRLAGHGIRTLAVSGNHDHGVLPRLADTIGEDSTFRLLGRNGRWERETIHDDGRPVLHVDGWSFPTPVVDRDPVESYPALPGGGVPVLGVVHGDLDNQASRYAPLSLARLRGQAVAGWLLGHIHRPHLLTDDAHGGPFVLYPGSPQALDFGEGGVHGPWALDVEGGRVTARGPVALSCCRYEVIDVDLTGVADESGFEDAVGRAMREAEVRMKQESGDRLEALALRLRLTGRSPLFDRLPALADSLSDYSGITPGLSVRIDRVRPEVVPDVDLAALALGSTPLAVTARLLRDLETTPGAAPVPELVAAVKARVDGVGGEWEYLAVQDMAPIDEASTRMLIRRQLNFIIGQLLRQQQDGAA